MRRALLALALASCAPPPPPPARVTPPAPAHPPRPTVAVLGLAADAPADLPRARALTAALRATIAAATSGPFALAPDRERDLTEMTAIGTCANEAAACMAAIGEDLRVDVVIYGHVRAASWTVTLLDVGAHSARRALTLAAEVDAATAYARLVDDVQRSRR